MTFDENSGLVKLWVKRVKTGKATLDDVPKIYNLPEVVREVIENEA